MRAASCFARSLPTENSARTRCIAIRCSCATLAGFGHFFEHVAKSALASLHVCCVSECEWGRGRVGGTVHCVSKARAMDNPSCKQNLRGCRCDGDLVCAHTPHVPTPSSVIPYRPHLHAPAPRVPPRPDPQTAPRAPRLAGGGGSRSRGSPRPMPRPRPVGIASVSPVPAAARRAVRQRR